jgi:hypothetical protein
MCFPSPGPRCSAHAHDEYLTAKSRYARATTSAESLRLARVLEEKTRIYDTTPRGMNDLQRAANATENELERTVLLQRFAVGRATRAAQLKAYNENQRHVVSSTTKALRESGITGRYEIAAGLAYAHMSQKHPDATVEIEDLHTLVLTQGNESVRVFVIPHKYQDFWAEVSLRDNRWVGAPGNEDLARVLNTQSVGQTQLHARNQGLLQGWFTRTLEARGYSSALAVDTRNGNVRELQLDKLYDVFQIDLTLREKRGGTTVWVGSQAELEQLLSGSVFAAGQLVKAGREYVISGVPQQSKTQLHLPQGLYMSWRETTEDFVARRVHASTKSSVIVRLSLISSI